MKSETRNTVMTCVIAFLVVMAVAAIATGIPGQSRKGPTTTSSVRA